MQVLADMSPQQVAILNRDGRPQHVLVSVSIDNQEWYLDGDGVSSQQKLLHRWQTEEFIDSPHLASYQPERSDIRAAAERSDALAAYLISNLSEQQTLGA
jgi:hypothetical protein